MKQILLKTPRGNTAVIPVDHFVSKANSAALSGSALQPFCWDNAISFGSTNRHNDLDNVDVDLDVETTTASTTTDEESTAAIAAAIDTTRIFEEDDVDKQGKEELLYELIGASKRRDIGRKRNVRSLYNLQLDDHMDSNMDTDMDIDGSDESVSDNSEECSLCSYCEEQKVATKFDGIDINSDEQDYQNFNKSRRRFSLNSGVRSSTITSTTTTSSSTNSSNTRQQRLPRAGGPFQQQQQQLSSECRKQIKHHVSPVVSASPTSSSSSTTPPPLMVAFYHQGRKVSLDRIWDWITGSSSLSTSTSASGISSVSASGSGARTASASTSSSSMIPQFPLYLTLSTSVRLLGGIDRQNRVGSKFGGGGVSSSQNAERERKERLKQLALESIDLAKDPYLMRNHLGTYECKLCLTLHTNEANYLAHTQGKKHQSGLAKRAHMEKLRAEREEQFSDRSSLKRPPPGGRYGSYGSADQQQQSSRKTIKIGRPAYQVFKSRDTDRQLNQRCLTFELTYKDIKEDLRPRHRFMSAFEQKVDLPRDKRYQYILFAAEPYETIAFKIPNEPLDRDPGRLITHWDEDDKKFTVTLYFAADEKPTDDQNDEAAAGAETTAGKDEIPMETEGNGMSTFAPALGSR